jgi:hypothetical protein
VLLKLIGTDEAGKVVYAIDVQDIQFNSGLELNPAIEAPAGWQNLESGQGEVGVRALNPVNCDTNPGAIRVNVEYYPYRYCYAGIGRNRISLRQVASVESRNWTVTVLWRPPGGRWMQTGVQTSSTHPFHQCGINWILGHTGPASSVSDERR